MSISTTHQLAFGADIAQTDHDIRRMQDRLATIQAWGTEYDCIGRPQDFASQTASVAINGTRITAISHSPIHTKVIANDSSSLYVLFAGTGIRSRVNDSPFRFERSHHIGFAPPGERIGQGDYRSQVIINVEPARIQTTMSAMLGREPPPMPALTFDAPAIFAARCGRVAFDQIIFRICSAFDPLCEDPDALDRSGFDESLYRVMAMLMAPQLFLQDETDTPSRSTTSQGVDRACQYIMANLDRPVTLSDLERISALSKRALQYGFRDIHSCTPMQWLREQRLQAIYRRLTTAQPDDTVVALASLYQFMSPGQFSVIFKKRFGILPSTLLE